MNYYLVPTSIAESLQLTRIRKSSSGGFYLLSEYDLQPYGIERAIEDGSIELSQNHTPVPVAEPEPQEQTPQEQTPQGQSQDEPQEDQPQEGTQEEQEPEEEPEQEPEEDSGDEPEEEPAEEAGDETESVTDNEEDEP